MSQYLSLYNKYYLKWFALQRSSPHRVALVPYEVTMPRARAHTQTKYTHTNTRTRAHTDTNTRMHKHTHTHCMSVTTLAPASQAWCQGQPSSSCLQRVLMDCEHALAEVLDTFADPEGAERGYKAAVDLGVNCRKMSTRGTNRGDRDRWKHKTKYYLSQGYLKDLRLAQIFV